MNRKIFIISLLGVSFYLGILFLVGSSLASLYTQPKVFSVNNVQRIATENRATEEWVVSGSGFDKDTRVVLSADIGNRRALIDSVPLWGAANDQAIGDEKIYIANISLGVQVLDNKDPLRPLVTKTVPIPSRPVGVYRDGNRLFVTCVREGVLIYDLNDSSGLKKQATVRVTGSTLDSLIDGDLLYVANGEDGVKIIDISNADAIGINKQYPIVSEINCPGRALSLELSGGVLFVSTDTSGLFAYDVVDPKRPELLMSIPSQDPVRAFHVEEQILYMATKSGQVSAFEISSLAAPSLLGSIFIGGKVSGLVVSENRLYLADGTHGLVVIDVNNPERLELLGVVDIPGQARSVTLQNDIAYVTSGSKGLVLVDLNKIGVPQTQPSISISGRIADVLFDGNWIYVSNAKGFHVFERNNNNVITPVNSLASEHYSYEIFKHGQYIYVAEERDGIGVVDVSDPRHPQKVAQLELPGRAKRMVLSDQVLIVAALKGGVHIVDLSVPDRPQLIETISDLGSVGNIATDGKFLYVSSALKGVHIYELIDGKHPVFISAVVKPWPLSKFTRSMDVELRNGLLYVASGKDGLQIIEVHDPYRPLVVGTLPLPGFGFGLYVEGDSAFVIIPQSGIYQVDITDPKHPRNLGCVVSTKRVQWMGREGGRLWVVTGHSDLKEVFWPEELLDVKLEGSEQIRVSLPPLNKDDWYSLNISSRNDHQTIHGISQSNVP